MSVAGILAFLSKSKIAKASIIIFLIISIVKRFYRINGENHVN